MKYARPNSLLLLTAVGLLLAACGENSSNSPNIAQSTAIPPATNEVTAVDDCDLDIPITFNASTNSGPCANSSEITRTWSGTDDCGNTVIATQIVIAVDYSTTPTNSVTISGPSAVGLGVSVSYTVPSPQPGAAYDWSFGTGASPSTSSW